MPREGVYNGFHSMQGVWKDKWSAEAEKEGDSGHAKSRTQALARQLPVPFSMSARP